MSIEYSGNNLWGESPLHYTCGCSYKAGYSECPVHNKPIKEQMLYGNEVNGRLDEVKYKENKLNEGFQEGDY
jgi:hypothetical protein